MECQRAFSGQRVEMIAGCRTRSKSHGHRNFRLCRWTLVLLNVVADPIEDLLLAWGQVIHAVIIGSMDDLYSVWVSQRPDKSVSNAHFSPRYAQYGCCNRIPARSMFCPMGRAARNNDG